MRFTVLLAIIILIAASYPVEVSMAASPQPLTLEWFGHSCFLLTLSNGAKILTDPYDTSTLPYALPEASVDVTFSTHDHFDHNAVKAVPAKTILRADGREPKFFGILTGSNTLPDGTTEVDLRGSKLTCKTVPSFHDERKGSQRGANGIIRFTVEGLTFVHVGDLGDTLTTEQTKSLQPIDVLLIPVGGYYTIDAAHAQKVVQALNPKVVIPMHFKTEILKEGFPITTVDPFLQGYANVHRNESSTIMLEAGKLPTDLTIEVLKYHGQK
ncbi:MAG TPA: MBL fold metallo-hydrolase [bacterium]|jgi:L-ascorbate metabolism protein UlaG (beta-lactamase superfamily)